MKTRFYFVRHGEARGNVIRRFHGWYDAPLTDNGFKQAERLRKRFKSINIDAIYSSDLARTISTVRKIAEDKNLEIIKKKELREINGGQWEDVPWADLPVKFPESYENWLLRPHLLTMPGGETMTGFKERVFRAVDEILSENEGKTVLIATHGTCIKVLATIFSGLDLCDMPDFDWYDNASVTTVDFENGEPSLISGGDITHIGELSTMAKQDWWKTR